MRDSDHRRETAPNRPTLFGAGNEPRDSTATSGIRMLSALGSSPQNPLFRRRRVKISGGLIAATALSAALFAYVFSVPLDVHRNNGQLAVAPVQRVNQDRPGRKAELRPPAAPASIESEEPSDTVRLGRQVASPFLVLAEPDAASRAPKVSGTDGKSGSPQHAHNGHRPAPRTTAAAAGTGIRGQKQTIQTTNLASKRDADVDLLEALVTHVRVQQARESRKVGTRLSDPQAKLLSSGTAEPDLLEKLKRCKSADPLEQEVCRVRACAAQWGKQASCLPKKEKT